MKKSTMGTAGWLVLGGIAAAIDVIQFLVGVFGAALSVFVVGAALVAANEVADPFIGAAIAGYLQVRGISMITHVNRLLSLLCVGGIDELTGGMASFWVVDIWYIYRTVKKENALIKAAEETQELLEQNARQPLHDPETGVRYPERSRNSEYQASNREGIRPPKKGVIQPRPQEEFSLAE